MRSKSILLTAVLTAGSMAALAADSKSAARAASGAAGSQLAPGVVNDPNSNPHGAPYAVWGVRWWQWALALPLHTNGVITHPLFTDGAVDCTIGQSGAVWFLAGSFAASAPSRSCAIPRGKALFFPLINAWVDNTGAEVPGDLFDPPGVRTLPQLQELAAAISTPASLFAIVDGASVPVTLSNRGLAAFQYRLPNEDNILQFFGAKVPGSAWPYGNTPAGTFVAPAASDGYWLMVEPLPPGVHTIRFGGTSTGGFSLDITYTITIN